MQAQIVVEQDNLVIRLPKNLISQEVLSQLLSFIEFTVITQKKMFSPANALLASQIQQEVAQNLNYAFLNDDVWQGEATPTDLADNHDRYLDDE